MPIYMIIPRYSHNYAQFCQLLNSNSFTHRKILMLLREATSETYGPRVYSHHINLHHFIYFLLVTIYLITKLSITYYFSACRENLTENRLSFPSAPHWVRHSYLSKGLR